MAAHNIDSLSTYKLEVSHPTLGAALNIPDVHIPQGSANIYQCFVGSAYNKVINASLVVGSNATNPQALNVTGESQFLGTTTILGNLKVVGAPSGGPKGSGVGKMEGSTEIAGKNFKITALSTEFTSPNFSITASTRLEINGTKGVDIRGSKLSVNAKTDFYGSVIIPGVGDVGLAINDLRTTKKTFDIKHPNKPRHRLRHACVEGPEAAVYVRGVLNNNNNIIELPDYWIGLIDPETITVNLTQIGHSQDLIVEKIEWGKKVFIKSGNGTSINCYYHIWADRLGEKLIVEYQGETPDDYPGDNSEYSIAGWTYDKRNS